MDKELYETAKEAYELSKYKHFQCSFELECKLFARIFDITIERFHAFLSMRAQILRRLPEEILATVEDLKKFAWGHMNQETKILLERFLKENKEN